jgi:dihydroorotate dehydrogenase subfamily 1
VADLSIDIAGVRFKNSVWISSSEVTEDFNKMKRSIDMGAGAVVAKSYTANPAVRKQTDLAKYVFLGYDRRPVYGEKIPKFYTNYCRSGIGRLEVSEDDWFEELYKTQKYAEKFDAQVIGSVFGETDVNDMVRLAKGIEQTGIKMLELDLGCPQPEEMEIQGGLLKASQEYVDVTRAVVKSVSIPVFIKLSPQQADLVVTAKAVKEGGAAGVTCHNRFLGFCIDIDNARPYIWGWAGVGGPWMLPIALRWVSKIYIDNPDLPILGSSGVYDHEDVVQYHMAGATAVEFCSTVMVKGFSVIREIVEGLNGFLDAKGYKSVRDIIGIATRAGHSYAEMYTLPEYQQRSSIDQTKCIHCGSCFELCWYGGIERQDEKFTAPCKQACPAGVDVPRYVGLTAEGKFEEALAVVREKIPFPSVCGTACFHPCETKCTRGQLDDPIAIMAIKGFIARRDSQPRRKKAKVAKSTGKRVAIIGSGPAGLTAAYYLAKLGHSVTVFEASAVAGGMMRVAIPDYRLPRELLEKEIDEIKSAGVEIRTNTKVDSLDTILRQGYKVIFLATGAGNALKLGVEGEDSPAVIECLAFLKDVKLGKRLSLGDKVVVIGGGNAAIDASRSALRLGAKSVTIIYRRSRAEMPASDEEVEGALAEGVNIQFLAAPTKMIRNNGRLKLECIRMKLGRVDASGRRRPEPLKGTEFNLDADSVIMAVGETPDIPPQFALKQTDDKRIWVHPDTLATSREGVFAGGDAVSGPASIIEAIASGRKAASSIDRYLGGSGVIEELSAPPAEEVLPLDPSRLVRERRIGQMLPLPLPKRLSSFEEVERGYTEEMAVREAKRCLQCDHNPIYTVNETKCKGCYNCQVICPVEGVIKMKTVG